PSARYQALLQKLLVDEQVRVRYFAALALGKIGKSSSVPAVLELIRKNADEDPWIRHVGIMALLGCSDAKSIAALSSDASPAVRVAAVVALRRLNSPALAGFVSDSDPRVVAEAARAINDLPVVAALPALAGLASKADQLSTIKAGEPTSPGPRDAILRRVLNANYRIGAPANSDAIAAMAGNEKLPEAIRVEALSMLGSWAKPDGKDKVSGLWRPLPERAAPNAHGLEPLAVRLIDGNAPVSAKVGLFEMAEKLGWKSLGDAALKLVKDTKSDKKARVAALNYLGSSKSLLLADAVNVAREDKAEDLRSAATKYAAAVAGAGGATASLEKTLTSGGTKEKQAALNALADLKEAAADSLLARWLDDLAAGKVAKDIQLELIEAAAKRTDPKVKDKLAKYNGARPDKEGIGLFLECINGGNAEQGKKIFFEKVEASCLRCHKVGTEGGEAGPILTDVGRRTDRNYILESIVHPNAKIAAGFETATLSLKNGTSVIGIVKRDNPDSLDVLSPEDGLVSVKKADIKSRGTGLSGMPDVMKEVLTKREIRDLVEYLGNLK
ncbi:MAG TPA: HEAT repeat domain-containing protein, partial [Roseimicrobium sp.]|nr:HEAT repeat domain-containing protein [Roseimicrobium sp.]